MEFLVELELNAPEETPASEVKQRVSAGAALRGAASRGASRHGSGGRPSHGFLAAPVGRLQRACRPPVVGVVDGHAGRHDLIDPVEHVIG
jgi:hypothetical protein